jgi:hypothetical protein
VWKTRRPARRQELKDLSTYTSFGDPRPANYKQSVPLATRPESVKSADAMHGPSSTASCFQQCGSKAGGDCAFCVGGYPPPWPPNPKFSATTCHLVRGRMEGALGWGGGGNTEREEKPEVVLPVAQGSPLGQPSLVQRSLPTHRHLRLCGDLLECGGDPSRGHLSPVMEDVSLKI